MKFKYLFTLTLGASLILNLASCNSSKNNITPNTNEDSNTNSSETNKDTEAEKDDTNKDNNELSLEIKNVPLIDTSEAELTLTKQNVKTYFYENGNVPMLGIKEFVRALDGWYQKDFLDYDIDEINNKAIISWKSDPTNRIEIDCEKETLSTTKNNFFEFLVIPNGENAYAHNENPYYLRTDKNLITYNLKDYDYDLFIDEDDVILPFTVITTLALTTNLAGMLFNGETFFFYAGYIVGDFDLKNLMQNNKLIGQNLPDDVLKERNNGLYFILDYFYGLKDELGISSFKDYVKNNPKIKSLIESNNPENTHKALSKLLVGVLDDPHTSLGFESFYKEIENEDDFIMEAIYEDVGERNLGMDETYYDLYYLYEDSIQGETIDSTTTVRSVDNKTAFVKFDIFNYTDPNYLYDEKGNLLPDAYAKDTFHLFLKSLNEIKEAHYENVVFDVTTNGGGSLNQARNLMGFLTNEPIKSPTIELTNKEHKVSTYAIDANFDGNFTDNDAFTDLNYFVLTSNYTFSAANYFAAMCKDMGVATLIGEKSGGGKCAVYEPTLLDGTVFSMSSPYTLSGAKYVEGQNPSFYSIENGVEVDLKIPRDEFYDLTKLSSKVESIVAQK